MKPSALTTACCAVLVLAGCGSTAPPTAGSSPVVPGAMQAQPQSQPAPYQAEEIEAMVAPIALYPDPLLSQVLMASTYPLEVTLAARWVKAHPGVKGDAAVKAIQNESWDVSVKSLVAFPQILEPMGDKLDWTQKLGDAFLAQQKDVLDAVQRLRARAQQAGHLKSGPQQTVTVETAGAAQQTIVRIEPANPEVIYVPVYDPAIVYGGWGYAGYPYYYWPPYAAYYPGDAVGSGIAWGIGLAAAVAIFGNCDWNNGGVHVEHHKARNIDRNFDASKFQGGRWQHDAQHRQGVAYRDHATREKFGRSTADAGGRDGFRGRDAAGGRDHGFQGVDSGGSAVQRNTNRGNASLQSGSARAAGFGGGARMGGFGGRGGRR
ncbi:DUF3300 domain-containing protein [Cupriavidus taiwanensis]|uniref:DUF3300 domain-containing protein n=1 Tax=Cupriavidus taiwanensis TaxID=164546 RepID=A0A375I809_9BURK|nr:DUF3300 domain-containing protein [Cupriavidus taiwanensis]SOY63653.1 conserved exported hypothetical protein [Cupriavidus taiwanensis]SOY63658.1 conserved exported hypothetical protein [Cupriavidus taiwanensis]SOY93780.1 conserved exported hypothetical protein [Cupriavidus taiwanensis]SOZ27038.1 conserved exported hypothetical protein [Cupriavidus taiwanensis]SOZ77422.1 conserved exported hypothetical protein [Cupriavidus taiwanensis]